MRPIRPADKKFAWVGFLFRGEVHVFQHLAMPFGAVAAVHNWDRVGKRRMLVSMK